MDRTNVAAILFSLLGVGSLGQFAVNPGLEAATLFSAVMGVGFLSLAIVMFRREHWTPAESGKTAVVPPIVAAALVFGVGVYLAV